jgi:transposase
MQARALWGTLTSSAIAAELGVSAATVRDWAKRYGWGRGAPTGRKAPLTTVRRPRYREETHAILWRCDCGQVRTCERCDDCATRSPLAAAPA